MAEIHENLGVRLKYIEPHPQIFHEFLSPPPDTLGNIDGKIGFWRLREKSPKPYKYLGKNAEFQMAPFKTDPKKREKIRNNDTSHAETRRIGG